MANYWTLENQKPLIEMQEDQIPRNEKGEKMIPVNGFVQVLELLKAADPAFRESLLSRIARRDQALASNLRRELKG